MTLKLSYLQGDERKLTFVVPDDAEPLIGRDETSSDITLHDPKVSRIHARIIRRDNEICIQDARSLRGVYLDDQRIEDYAPLHDGAMLQLGDSRLQAHVGPWIYKPDGTKTRPLGVCSNRDCGYQLSIQFRFCPYCGQEI